MLAIQLRFPAGRYHATPWEAHVNEGTPEWPPSPWRLLRALVAVWKRTLCDQIQEREMRLLLTELAVPPLFELPAASTGHSRHYMPWFKKGPGDKTKVFDAFVALPRESAVIVLWPSLTLGDGQRRQLSILLDNLGFLGRAESWCDGGLLDAAAEAIKPNCTPQENAGSSDGGQPIRVLCADPATAFGNLYTAKATRSLGSGKSKRTVVSALYDPDWHLAMETLELHKQRWSDPPGSRWVQYARRRDCFKIEPRPHRALQRRHVQVARFALDSSVLPLVTKTLSVAETARRHVMGIFGRLFPQPDGSAGRSDIFSGKDISSLPLTGHQHAYYLPTDEDGDGRLYHLTIVAEQGFRPEEMKALDRLQELKSREREESGHPLRVLWLGWGQLSNCQPEPLRPSTTWVSATPFVAPRYPKARGTKRDPPEILHCPPSFLETVLREELARLVERHPDLQGVASEQIQISPCVDQHGVFRIRHSTTDPLGLRPLQFARYRQKRGDDGGRRAAGAYRITFPHEVRGPICLGHSSHFGLGLFVPE